MTIFFVIVPLIMGIFLLYFIGKRRFLRRGFSGLPQFRSYRAALLIRFLEYLLQVLAWSCIALALFALVLWDYNR
jgi:hypothetical protein